MRKVAKTAAPTFGLLPGDFRIISGLTAVVWLLPYLYLVSRAYKVPFLGTYILDRDRTWFMLAPFCHAVALALLAWATRRLGGGKRLAALAGAFVLAAAPPVFFFLKGRVELSQAAGKAFISLLPLIMFWLGYLAVSGYRAANQILAVAFAMAGAYQLVAACRMLGQWQDLFVGGLAMPWLGRLLMAAVAAGCVLINQRMLAKKPGGD